jgi:hypothetical protein
MVGVVMIRFFISALLAVTGMTPAFAQTSTLTFSLPATGNPGSTLVTVNTSTSAGYGPWQITGVTFNGANPDGLPDHVMNLGWNIGANGAPLIRGKMAARIAMESHFDVFSNPNDPDMEIHLASFYDTNSREYRMLSTAFYYNSAASAWQGAMTIAGQTVAFTDTSGNNLMLEIVPLGTTGQSGGNFYFDGPSNLYFSVNNHSVMWQMSSTGSFLNLPFVNGSNQVEIDPPLLVVGGATLNGPLNIKSGLAVGGQSGVSCSASAVNLSTLTITLGVVTHC